jgi:membrane-bound metal-dependent hydrolase YbcI (DUF457 family)
LILLANAPDLDLFLPPGFPNNALHRGFTHSLTLAIAVSVGLSLAWQIAPGFWRSAILYFSAYSSHLLIDLFTGTNLGWTHTGFGIPLFWPWHQNFSSPLILVPGVHHKTVAALFSLDNLWVCIYETLTFGAVTAIASVLWKQKLKSRISGKQKLKLQTNRLMPQTTTRRLPNLQYRKKEGPGQPHRLRDHK